jgi:hypothetical protein
MSLDKAWWRGLREHACPEPWTHASAQRSLRARRRGPGRCLLHAAEHPAGVLLRAPPPRWLRGALLLRAPLPQSRTCSPAAPGSPGPGPISDPWDRPPAAGAPGPPTRKPAAPSPPAPGYYCPPPTPHSGPGPPQAPVRPDPPPRPSLQHTVPLRPSARGAPSSLGCRHALECG